MNENELRLLEHLVNKYRSSFAWNLGKSKDQAGAVSDAMLTNIRQTIRNGGTYNDKRFSVKELPA